MTPKKGYTGGTGCAAIIVERRDEIKPSSGQESAVEMSLVRNARKIVAIGRNYADHAKELGNAVPKEPFFFLKPTSSLIESGHIEIPQGVSVHHEIELGVVIGKTGRDIKESEAMSFVDAYFLGIDVTGRNLQDIAKREGKPWSAAKGYDTWTPISHRIPKSLIADPHSLNIWLKVNGALKQSGSTGDMIFKVPTLLAFVSRIMRLEEGDLILTGTPKGVGPIVAGDVITAGLTVPGSSKDLIGIEFGVADRQ